MKGLTAVYALLGVLVVGGVFFSFSKANWTDVSYQRVGVDLSIASTTVLVSTSSVPDLPPPPRVTHIDIPNPLKAIYMTSCVAATPSLRARLVKIIEDTELNAVIMDIKDYTGTISFDVGDEKFISNTKGCFVKDMREFINTLHDKGIFVIGRVQVFQDGSYTKSHPDLAVKKKDGTIWKDYKGIYFIDVGARPYWDHVVNLAKRSYAIGFDEINFDYIRYPSDGDLKDIWFSQSGSSTKPAMLEEFFKHLRAEIPQSAPVISADLFGMAAVNTDDLNIGQVIERAFPYFDYIAPMVYPSHFPNGFNGWKNPNAVPGDIIRFSMGKAVERAHVFEKIESGYIPSTSTPKFIPTGVYSKKLRPWLQDFDYGGDYDATDVRAQIQATYDVGLKSWALWDPANVYTREALMTE